MIKSAKFSLVRFEHPIDNDYSLDQPYTLPAYGQHDVAFQFLVEDDRSTGEDIKLGICNPDGTGIVPFAGPINASIVAYRYRLTGYLSYSTFVLNNINYGGIGVAFGGVTVTREQFEQIMFDQFGQEMTEDYFIRDISASFIIDATDGVNPTSFSGSIAAVWHQGFVNVSGVALPSTNSFAYALLNTDDSLLGYSNEFVITDEQEYTSLISYSCNENGFEFHYSGGQQNKIRLPLYLLRPQMPKKRTVNRKSDGSNQVLSALVEKEYEIATEQMPEVFHECVAVMLSHDNITIECTNVRENPVQIIEADNYSPQWEAEEERFPLAKAKGKVKVATFGYSNSNC